MCSTEIRHILGKKLGDKLVIDNESRDLQLYNDSFLILIEHAKAELKQSYCPLKFHLV